MDSWCELSILPDWLIPNSQRRPTTRIVLAANGSAIPVVSTTAVTATTGRDKLEIEGLVPEDISEPMLGIEWMEKNGVFWMFGRGAICIRGKTYPLSEKKKTNVWAQPAALARATPLSPLSAIIEAKEEDECATDPTVPQMPVTTGGKVTPSVSSELKRHLLSKVKEVMATLTKAQALATALPAPATCNTATADDHWTDDEAVPAAKPASMNSPTAVINHGERWANMCVGEAQRTDEAVSSIYHAMEQPDPPPREKDIRDWPTETKTLWYQWSRLRIQDGILRYQLQAKQSIYNSVTVFGPPLGPLY